MTEPRRAQPLLHVPPEGNGEVVVSGHSLILTREASPRDVTAARSWCRPAGYAPAVTAVELTDGVVLAVGGTTGGGVP